MKCREYVVDKNVNLIKPTSEFLSRLSNYIAVEQTFSATLALVTTKLKINFTRNNKHLNF